MWPCLLHTSHIVWQHAAGGSLSSTQCAWRANVPHPPHRTVAQRPRGSGTHVPLLSGALAPRLGGSGRVLLGRDKKEGKQHQKACVTAEGVCGQQRGRRRRRQHPAAPKPVQGLKQQRRSAAAAASLRPALRALWTVPRSTHPGNGCLLPGAAHSGRNRIEGNCQGLGREVDAMDGSVRGQQENMPMPLPLVPSHGITGHIRIAPCVACTWTI